MATKHYQHYPCEENIPQVLAYGFRPFLLILPWYIAFNIILWSLAFSGVISFSLIDNLLQWHIYEMLFGVGMGGILAFMLTALPEMYPGVIPIVNKKLLYIVIAWSAGRVGFWLIDIIGVTVVALLNLVLFIWLLSWVFKPVLLDPLQRSASVGYTLIALFILQVLFFASHLQLTTLDSMSILYASIGAFMILILLLLRRINMEIINERMEIDKQDDVFKAKPYRYNLAIFCIILFTIVEFFYPNNSVLIWLGLACGAAILGIINDYNLEYESILFKPYTLYLSSILICMALGYIFLGINTLFDWSYQSHFRHFITTGAFGLTFFMVMVIVAYVHTGRQIESNTWIALGVILLLCATLLRVGVIFFQEYYFVFIEGSTLLFTLPFILYFFKTKDFFLQERFDGIKG